MAFIKTSIAIGNVVSISDEQAREMSQSASWPADPKVGDVHEGFVWDGGAWVTVEVWAARHPQIPAEG